MGLLLFIYWINAELQDTYPSFSDPYKIIFLNQERPEWVLNEYK